MELIEQLKALFSKYLEEMNAHNIAKRKPEHKCFFEDDVEPNLENFIRWLYTQ
jgi:hypothetical protein